ncbi:MAG: phage tail tape measure protein, partial [Prevotella shahii]|uniref:phage tail tape measure protein n=1 Tax=Hoylesella shahii TaxID=228603 RepID=UPI001CB33BB0
MSKIKEDHIALVIDVKTAEAQQQMRQLERATADLRKEMKARQNAMLELEATGKKDTEEYQRLRGEMQKYNAQIKENEHQLRGMRQGMDISAMTMAQLRMHARELQTELNNTSKATSPKEYEQLASQLRNVNGRMAELRADASRLASTTGEQMGGISSKFGSLFTSISANWTKAMGMITAGVAALSAVIEGAKWWYNYNSEIEEAQRLTREFTGLAGDELVSVRSHIQAIADTFGKDYKDVLGGVDALMSQYGISAQEAMKIVEDGFTAGADLGGNMLSMISQYGPAFNDAGIGASELVAIIAQTRSGIFSEGGMSLIQMASKKIREMEKTTAASLDGIGINSKKLQSELRSGAKG